MEVLHRFRDLLRMTDQIRWTRCFSLACATGAALGILIEPAWAHSGEGASGGFWSGFLHPVTGLDHLIAMVGVGIWGAFLGVPAIWLLPVIFPLVMAVGGVIGIIGVPLPSVETWIAASAVAIGLGIALALRPPLSLAILIVAVFAIFHGYAHGTEMPHTANPLAYAVGFVLATGALHLCGIAFGLLERNSAGRIAVRATGGVIAMLGVGFLTGAL